MDAMNTLLRLEQGHFIEDLAAELEGMSDAVYAAGKGSKGKVTVTFDVERPKDAFDLAVVIRATFARAQPKTSPRGMMFFVFDGGLHMDDPRKPELPSFRTVERPESEERAVEERTAERKAD